MENSTKTENTIDLRRLWMLLRAHIWSIILWTIGLGAVGFILAAFVVEPKYTSTTQILVNQKRNENDANQAFNAQQADVQVINTYKDIVTSPVILKDASKWIKNPNTIPAKVNNEVLGNVLVPRAAGDTIVTLLTFIILLILFLKV